MTAIYISKHVDDKYKAQMNELANAYESARNKKHPNVIHKFTGHAFIDWKLHAKFVNGIPIFAFHNGNSIGECSLIRQSPSDRAFSIPKSDEFNKFLLTHKNFTLQVGSFSDGCSYTTLAEAFDDHGVKLADFSEYD